MNRSLCVTMIFALTLTLGTAFGATVGPFTFTETAAGTCNFWAGLGFGSATVDGVDVAVGDVIGAFVSKDSVNDLCIGAYLVDTEGAYGLLATYGDDPTTPEKDGATPGETVHFKIWDASQQCVCYAVPGGPDGVNWTNGDTRNVSLAATCGISADDTGAGKDVFAQGETIYGQAVLGLAASTSYDLYVVANRSWSDGDAIPARTVGSETSFTTDGSGNMAVGTLLWDSPTPGLYDIVVDVNGNGTYNLSVDYLDDNANVGAQALPVELTGFTGVYSDGEITLSWTTSSETRNVGWHVYRAERADGAYTQVTRHLITGAGTSAELHQYHFTDSDVVEGKTYFYYIEDTDYSGMGHESFRIEVPTFGTLRPGVGSVPLQTRLLQNYPNPFNPETWIPFQLATPGNVSIRIYDTRGSLIRSLELGQLAAGKYLDRSGAAYWDGRNAVGQKVASGLYFYQLVTPDFQQTRRLVILK